jgi:2-amino-4-hydroxy-6-hydroxymethyldihydropteridine diphosphokinase
MNTIYLLTGSNIGDSLGHLNQAIRFIQNQVGRIVQQSSVYKTEPWGNKNQQDFLNQVLAVETNLTAGEVLHSILSIEHEMGRNRHQKWEPRIIDIDILFYGSEIMNDPNLVIPHPLLHERKFTLLPLNEIAPLWVHPVFNQTIEHLLQICQDMGKVEKV